MRKLVLTLAIMVHSGVLATKWNLLTPQAMAEIVDKTKLAQLNAVEEPLLTDALIEEEQTPTEEVSTELEAIEEEL